MSEKKKGKKKIKGMRGGIEAEVEELEDYSGKGLPSSMTQNADIWWGVFKLLKGDRKLDFLNATLETETREEFWEGVRLFDAVEEVFNDLVTKALEYFSAFLHERGILSDAELRKIEKK